MNNKTLSRLSVLLAALLLLSMALSACGSTEPPEVSTELTQAVATVSAPSSEAVPEETEPDYDPHLEASDWEGETFTVLHNGNTLEPNWDFTASEINGSPLNDAVYNRNVVIQEKYHLVINPIFSDESNISSKVRTAISSGTDSYQLVEANQVNSMSMAINGQLYELADLENIHLDKPYWFSSALKGSSLAGKNYFAYSDTNIHAFGATPCTLFNKTVAEAFKVGNIYEIVENGEWTYARMSEMVKAVTGDLDGDLAITKDDRLGLIANSFCVDCFISGSGYQMIVKDENDLPVININTEQFLNIIDGITSLCAAENGMFFVDRTSTATEAREYWPEYAITADRALFWIGNFKCVERLRVSETDFGVVPIPKANADQPEYKIHMQATIGGTSAVPVSVRDPEKVSAVLEDLAFRSSISVMPTYMEVLIQGQYIRDVESLQCIKLIRQSYYCDMGFMLANSGISILNNMRTVVSQGTPVSSLLATYAKSYDAKLTSIRKKFLK